MVGKVSRTVSILGVILVAIVAFGGCDWFHSDSPTEPNSPDFPREPVRVFCYEVDSLLPAFGQLVSVGTGADGYADSATLADGGTPRRTLSFPVGFFSERDRYLEVGVRSPFPCGNSTPTTPRCYEARFGNFPITWREDTSEGKYLAVRVELRRTAGSGGQAEAEGR